MTGAAPVVDTQSMRQQQTINSSELDALPSGNIGLQTLAYVTPGFATTQADVGGTRDTLVGAGRVHALPRQDRHARVVRRFPQSVLHRRGIGRRLHHRQRQRSRRLQLETSGMGADSGSGSTSLNAIPRSGGNSFRGDARRLLLERRDAGQQPERLPRARSTSTRRPKSSNIYRIGAPARRADHARQGLVLRGGWPVGVARQPARRVLQPAAGHRAIQRPRHALLSGTARNVRTPTPPTTPVGRPPASTGIGRTRCA